MEQLSITKEFTWDMAHMLANHQGVCKNLHGHTYKMLVKVAKINNSINSDNNNEGMVVDFSELKDIVQKNIINKFDHSFVYWSNSPDQLEHEIANLLKKYERKVIAVEYRPTAEEICINFFRNLNMELSKINIKVINIKIWETPTSFAEIKSEE
jgi:6-pyruvoyltetrahydropterin/6-carboxytetrahydropterin synthase